MKRLTAWGIPLMLFLAGCGGPVPPSDTARGSQAGEVDRVHAHLGRVEAQLRSRHVAGLTAAQREARADALDWLREYRQGRSYPHNHVRPVRTPVFVDAHGTPCAVGYLMLRSGEHALVADIVRESNLARVPELAGDPRLSRWLEAHGLSLEEAAAIQPWYGPAPPPAASHEGYQMATAGVGLASTILVVHNAATTGEPTEGSTWTGLLAMGLGMAHAGMALNALADDSRQPGWAVAVNVFGAIASTMTGAVKTFGHRRDRDDGPAVQPLVSGGPNGVGLGLTVSH